MAELVQYLHEFNFVTVCFRLLLAMVCGGVIGYGRSAKSQNAGLRTYILTAIGASLAVLLSCYEYEMLEGPWAEIVAEVGLKFDGSRYASQVISGIGFLAAGTILSSGHRQVTGLTTAAGLFASVCMGLAAGAGIYSCVFIVLIMLIIVLDLMSPLEFEFKRQFRNMTMYVEVNKLQDLDTVVRKVKSENCYIFDIDIERSKRQGDKYPAAILTIRLPRENRSHSSMLSSVAEIPCVCGARELIS